MAITKGSNYYNQASAETSAEYESQKTALKNQLASNLQANQAQVTGVNANYDQQVGRQNIANTASKNNISNSALGRGLSRSSIVTSGLAESDQINNRQVGYINTARTGALNDIENQGRILQENFNNSLATLEGTRESQIMKLARELEDTDWNRNFQNKQYDLSVRAQAAQEKYQQAQIGLQRAANAAQASYWNQQMALARDEFNAAQKAAQDKTMGYNDRNSAVSNMMAIMNDDSISRKDKMTALKTMGMSGDSYVDQLANQYLNNMYQQVGNAGKLAGTATSGITFNNNKIKTQGGITSLPTSGNVMPNANGGYMIMGEQLDSSGIPLNYLQGGRR